MKTFSILGTGWLGLALANNLKDKYKVKVSIRSEEKRDDLSKEGFYPSLLNESEVDSLDELLDTDYLFINFPPSKFENYVAFLNKIYSHKSISSIEKIIFISSTSIYPREDGFFNEEEIVKNPISKKVFDAENLVWEKSHVIFRCSGLMGYNRIAGRYFSGKEIDTGNIKVNYIHRDDVINATLFSIENDINGVFNLCSKEHPSRKEIYLHNSKKYGFEAPIFLEEKEQKNRLIDGSKIEKTGFKYKYSNPYDYI